MIDNNLEMKELIQKISGKKDISKIRLYKGTGCSACNGTGYRGRMGIFEIFQITEELRTLVVQKASADVIQTKARELGMNSMVEDGIRKAFQGDTTISEVMRVTRT